jgi:hypothetical protein
MEAAMSIKKDNLGGKQAGGISTMRKSVCACGYIPVGLRQPEKKTRP